MGTLSPNAINLALGDTVTAGVKMAQSGLWWWVVVGSTLGVATWEAAGGA